MVRIYGYINRKHLEKKFEISTPQASMDLQYFQKNNAYPVNAHKREPRT